VPLVSTSLFSLIIYIIFEIRGANFIYTKIRRESEKNNSHYNRVKEAENIIKFANERGYCSINLNLNFPRHV